MPLQATSGAASYDAFGGGVAVVPQYIEDVFSCFLYDGNGDVQTITNNIDLSTKGGLVWFKNRGGVGSHALLDTARGVGQKISSDLTNAQNNVTDSLTSFNTNGFSVGLDLNGNTRRFVSWTFRKQPKFFDVVTWTGDAGGSRSIAHSLAALPGCVIIKRTDTTANWVVGARVFDSGSDYVFNEFRLNTTDASLQGNFLTGNTTTTFNVGTSVYAGSTNVSGATYVAYLFAHNAGGFGLTGTDNVISCGSFTASGNSATVTLGWEPQWILFKKADNVGDWMIFDTMRGWSFSSLKPLNPNNSTAEQTETGMNSTDFQVPTATGFKISNWFQDGSWIYIAIRRGPMKVPTVGTSVYNAIARTGTGATATVSSVGFSPDLFIGQIRGTAGYWNGAVDRLRGVTKRLVTSQTNSEDTTTNAVTSFTMDGVTLGADSNGFVNESGKTYIEWNFRRAPSFFDVVCYKGIRASRYTNVPQTINHGLNAVPELIILKSRSNAKQWIVYAAPLTATKHLQLESTLAAVSSSGGDDYWNSQTPSASEFYLGESGNWDNTCYVGLTYVAYLFATCAGVSKVGSYTGTGALQTVNCGFTSGARFVLIKRTDSTGDWWTYDSARGISSGNDPYLYLNSTAAEVTGTNYVDTDSTGFKVTAAAPAGLNASGGTYIFLAIA